MNYFYNLLDKILELPKVLRAIALFWLAGVMAFLLFLILLSPLLFFGMPSSMLFYGAIGCGFGNGLGNALVSFLWYY